ncbi:MULTISPECIES: YeaC family protein [unclassified Hahella]|uniref:YeaC family protein n=1 Tax=unclassified Hahella TaxID=2624107 RepID=UPI001C1EFFA9|nr:MULTISPECIES: DUF1315 family protein [unclassified Hahella]MBU6952167.1 DUF1315 family protein [Hahella sp. HN01]MDG9667511.1 DUF1315 family protein [Hahella sp. CR1]
MSFENAVKNLTPEIYEAMKTALELGKWPDGKKLSMEQKELCMEALITYEISHNVPEEQRVGYIERDRPTPCALKAAAAESSSGVWTPDSGVSKH